MKNFIDDHGYVRAFVQVDKEVFIRFGSPTTEQLQNAKKYVFLKENEQVEGYFEDYVEYTKASNETRFVKLLNIEDNKTVRYIIYVPRYIGNAIKNAKTKIELRNVKFVFIYRGKKTQGIKTMHVIDVLYDINDKKEVIK